MQLQCSVEQLISPDIRRFFRGILFQEFLQKRNIRRSGAAYLVIATVNLRRCNGKSRIRQEQPIAGNLRQGRKLFAYALN